MKLAIFDFDSTLMNGETIDLLAQANGSADAVQTITKEAMGGKMDFHQSLKLRVATLKGMPLTKVQEVCNSLKYNLGAKELIEELKARNYKIVVFSGGFDEGVSAGQKVLGYHIHFSNKLHHKDGILTGEVGGEMMFNYSKGRMTEKIQTLLNATYESTIAIGDGANDVSMFHCAKKKVAFCAKPILKEAANIVIDEKNLMLIAKHLD
ncbi:phosphoserine phosphatase SerB [Helicobacter turcicus]|uniref:Phosphoserine phosphatase n=1 Tax=Helicobacter turcicus TaxID=2867412 RepID=A0ABS7JL49_9HELI|nr:phosphoserine phosphatase SerB [Helicobacter turcicus]MBX7490124.1 phosphoserine phosphatase SerB [Helicobacter turcicus]MBX7544983.1 phosphoserine phosphatase SerB [Helicobacter turcicus]